MCLFSLVTVLPLACAPDSPQRLHRPGVTSLYGTLTGLVSLSLSYTAVSTGGMAGVSALTALTALNLDSCHVGDAACKVRKARKQY